MYCSEIRIDSFTTHAVSFSVIIRYNRVTRKYIGLQLKEDDEMKLALILGVAIVFITSCFTSGYESKPGMPKKQQST